MVDTGNQSRETIISEDLFRRISPNDAEIKPTTVAVNGIEDSMNIIGRSADELQLEFYSPAPRFNKKVMYPCKPLVARNCNIDFLLSNADLCKMDVTLKPKDGVMFIPLNKEGYKGEGKQKSLAVPMKIKPIRPSPVCTIQDETIHPGKEIQFHGKVNQKVGRDVEVVLDDYIQPDSDQIPLVGACTRDVVRPHRIVTCRIANVGDQPITIRRGTQIGTAFPIGDDGLAMEDKPTCAAMERTTQFQGRQQRELNREAFGEIKTRAQIKDRIWEDLNFNKESFGLDHSQKIALVNQMAKYRSALALEFDDLGLVKDVKISINTGDANPIKARCRPLAPHLKKPLKEQVERWLSQGIIAPCDGPWASPIVAVPKKNGGWRFCADYRALNAVTKRDSRPVANLEEKLAQVRGDHKKPIKFYASLDLSEAYHSVEIDEKDQEKTALITPMGLYKYMRMSFGLASAPMAFHEVVKKIEDAMEKKDPNIAASVLLYFDDALITAATFEELQRKLDIFYSAIAEVGMRIQPRKCNFGLRTVKWLGHTITEQGIYPDQDRVRILRDWPEPTTRSHVSQIHGLMSTFRKFIRNFAARTVNIRKLLKRDPGTTGKEPVQWTQECRDEMKDVVETLISGPMVGHPNFAPDAPPFIVTVDTSRHGMGCTLSQEQNVTSTEDPKKTIKQEVILYFGSRKLTTGESRYSAYKLELTGLTSAVEHFRFYLLGKPFIVRTDCKSLEWLRKTKNQKTPAMCYRWQELLSEYDFTIQYIPGAQLKLVDSLSRRPYKTGESGNVIPLLPKRDKIWDDDCPVTIARECSDDDTWIPIMTKRFGDPKDNNNNLDVIASCFRDPSTLWSNSIPTMKSWTVCALEPGKTPTRKTMKPPHQVMFVKLSDNAEIPTRDKGGATFNLFAAKGMIVRAGHNAIIPTDIEVTIPDDMYGQIVTPPQPTFRRAMHHVLTQPAIIEATLRTNVHVVLLNNGVVDYVVQKGDKIGGLLLGELPRIKALTVGTKQKDLSLATSVQGNPPTFRGGNQPEMDAMDENKPTPRIWKPEPTPTTLDLNEPYPRSDIRRYMTGQNNPMISGTSVDDNDSEIEILDYPLPRDPMEITTKSTSTKDPTPAPSTAALKQKIDTDSDSEIDVVGHVKEVCVTELTGEETSMSKEIDRLQETRFQELNHQEDTNTVTQKVFAQAKDMEANLLRAERPQERNLFWDWIIRMQFRDEACLLLLDLIAAYHEEGKYDLGEEQRKIHAERTHGKEREMISDLRRILPEMEWDESEERTQKQIAIFKTLRQLFIKGQIPPIKPLRVGTQEGGIGKGPLIIPLDNQEAVIQSVHHGPGTFHLGVNRTETIIKRFAYFPRMLKIIGEYIKFCDQCQRGKRIPIQTSPGMGKTSSLRHKPLQCWSIDVIFMPKGTNGMKFLLTLVDLATSWVEAFPMRNNNSRTVATLIKEEVIPRFGEGLVFISDQGKEQTAKIVLNAIHQAGGQHYATTAYHSKSNPVERTNLTIGQLLRIKLIDSDWPKEKWPKCLPEALYTMRMSPDTQTKDSPFLRVYGRKPYTRIDTWLGKPFDDDTFDMSPWYPGEIEEENEDSLLQESDTQVTIQRKTTNGEPQTCTYNKITSKNGNMTHLTVASLETSQQPIIVESTDTVRKQAQERRYQSAAKRHQENAGQLNKKYPNWYSPVEGELVDWQAAVDPDSTNNRKMRQTWIGPYRVTLKPDHDFTCHIMRIHPITLNCVNEPIRKVAVEKLRPSTTFRKNRRPHGEDFLPEWKVDKEHNYTSHNEYVDEQDTDDDKEQGHLPRMRKRETKDALGKKKNKTTKQ